MRSLCYNNYDLQHVYKKLKLELRYTFYRVVQNLQMLSSHYLHYNISNLSLEIYPWNFLFDKHSYLNEGNFGNMLKVVSSLVEERF